MYRAYVTKDGGAVKARNLEDVSGGVAKAGNLEDISGGAAKAGNLEDVSGGDTKAGDLGEEYYDVALRYDRYGLKHFQEINAGLLGISMELYRICFDWEDLRTATQEQRLAASQIARTFFIKDEAVGLIRLESMQLLNQGTYVLFFVIVIAFLLLIYVGVFCINNSFDLSFTERVRYYGMMASIGTTKRQRKVMVLMEGGIIAAFGISLGILLGVLGTAILVRFTNDAISILEKNSDFVMLFHVSFPAVFVSAGMSVFMVWLSSSEATAKAARITPISAIRLSNMVKEEKRRGKRKENPWTKQRTPRCLKKLFGAPRHLAWLHFTRAKVKYRGTVTAIAISAALFVGLSFLSLFFEARKQNLQEEIYCQLEAYTYEDEGENYQKLKEFQHYPGVTKAEISTSFLLYVEDGSIPYLPGKPVDPGHTLHSPLVKVVDEETFAELCNRAGISPADAKGKGIVNAAEVVITNAGTVAINGRKYRRTGESLASFHQGDVIEGEYRILNGTDSPEKYPVSLEIIAQADDVALMEDNGTLMGIIIYVDEEWAREKPWIQSLWGARGCFMAEDINALEEAMASANLLNCSITNHDKEYQKLRFTEFVIKTFLFSFLFIVGMIGVSNVINAISTNMSLRMPEFARLRAIGMTDRQFRDMIWTETVIIGGKGLFWGSAVGIFISYALYRFMWESGDKNFDFAYHLPFGEIAICALFVGIVLFLVTKSSLKRMTKNGIMEDIRRENT